MALVTLVEPAQEPVSLAEMKNFLRIDTGDTGDDALIAAFITAARRWVEEYLQRRLVYQTLRLYMDFFPGYVDMKMAGEKVSSPFVSGSNAVLVGIRYAIALPLPPVRAVLAFQYQDQNGTPHSMVAGTEYFADLQSQPARLTPPFGQMWPVARVIANAVNVDFICGFGGPVTVGIAQGSAALTGATFYASDVGQAISIPGAGTAGAALSTTIAAVDGSGNATVTAAAATTVANATAWLGKAVPPLVNVAIQLMVSRWYENRIPDDTDVPTAVKSILAPYRDLRF